jgi:hypothetical protein
MRKISFTAAIAAAVAVSACSDTFPTASNSDLQPSYANETSSYAGNKLQCFSGTTDPGDFNGTCTLIENGAELNTIDGDLDPNNNYAGVYIYNSNLDGKALVDVNKLSFDYDGSTASGGSPRLSIPIDEDGDGDTDGYAFIDTLGCNDGSPDSGTLDAINDPTCLIWYGSTSYVNWAAFVAANPDYRIGDAIPFMIVDQPGDFTVTNIQLGKGAAKSRP